MIASTIQQTIEAHIQSKITHQINIGGGCIARCQKLTTANNQILFLKTGNIGDMFRKEANSLLELKKANTIRVPKVLLATKEFLLIEYITTGRKESSFFSHFGKQLATLHQFTRPTYGFIEDNYIGTTMQKNCASVETANNWSSFYYHNRLHYQFNLAEKNGYVTDDMRRAYSILENKLEEILAGSEEPPTLLHGDLWGGNYMVDESGCAVLIDPAVYYGHREADLAMTHIFGGFSTEFYDTYNTIYPLKEGYEYRTPLYKLYHILNHLNLFGRGYYHEALQLMRYYQ